MVAELCSAFSDPTRILILYVLDQSPHTVTEITYKLNLPQPTISRHLKILRDRGLVTAERQGMNMIYQLTDRRLLDALDIFRTVMRDRILHHANLVADLKT